MHADAFPLARTERARLVPDRVGHAEPPEARHQRRTPHRARVGGGHTQLDRGIGGECRERTRVAEEVRGFQIDEIGYGREGGVDLLARQRHCQGRFGIDYGVPGADLIEVRQDQLSFVDDEVAETGVELLAALLARECLCFLDAADAVRDLDNSANCAMRAAAGTSSP